MQTNIPAPSSRLQGSFRTINRVLIWGAELERCIARPRFRSETTSDPPNAPRHIARAHTSSRSSFLPFEADLCIIHDHKRAGKSRWNLQTAATLYSTEMRFSQPRVPLGCPDNASPSSRETTVCIGGCKSSASVFRNSLLASGFLESLRPCRSR